MAIHHPNTDEKAISFQYDPLTVTTYRQSGVPGDGSHWRVDDWEDGTTEPGSSGSGLWDPNHRLVGQLHGGYASCSSITSDWYGRLSVSWDGSSSANRLRDWLDPSGSGQRVADGSFEGGVGSLQFVSESDADACASGFGDGNGVWEPGETISLSAILWASGGAMTNIAGVLSTTTPGVSITTSAATWPNLASGATASNDTPDFVITLDETIDCYSTIDFQLETSSTEGGPWTYGFSKNVGQAAVPGDLPITIPDGSGSATSYFAVAQNDILSDVNVRVEISHTWVGDLTVQLRSPSGTTITLLDRPGVPSSTYGCSDDNLNVTFDDASGVNLEGYCAGSTPWYSGVAAPAQALSAFNGQSTQGTWQLIVSDAVSADEGTIIDWEILSTPALGGTCEICVTSGVEAPSGELRNAGFSLSQNRPNPFSPKTVIEFSLPTAGPATLEVFDVAGRRVRTLVDQSLPAGPHVVTWDGTDSNDHRAATGIYFYRLTAADETSIKRMIRMR